MLGTEVAVDRMELRTGFDMCPNSCSRLTLFRQLALVLCQLIVNSESQYRAIRRLYAQTSCSQRVLTHICTLQSRQTDNLQRRYLRCGRVGPGLGV